MAKLLMAVLTMLGVLASGCTLMLSGSAMDGRVVEDETGAPIPGALVIVEWKGDIGGPVQSSQVCFHLEVVRTDDEGRYHVPAWHRRPAADWEGGFYGVRNTEVTRRTYKQGYTQLRYDTRDRMTILMTPYNGPVADRLDYLARLGTRSCGATDGTLTQEAAIWEAVCAEARKYSEARVAQPRLSGRNFLELVNSHIDSIARRIAATDSAVPKVSMPSCS